MELDLHEFSYKIVQELEKTQLYLKVVVNCLIDSIRFLARYKNASRDILMLIYLDEVVNR